MQDQEKIKEAGLKVKRDTIIRESGLKLDYEQTEFLLYTATRSKFDEAIEKLEESFRSL